MLPVRDAGYTAIHEVKLVKGQVDHVVIGPSGVYMLEPVHSSLTRSAAKKRAFEHATLVRRQLAASGAEWKVLPVLVLMGKGAPKGITEVKSHSVVDLPSLGTWVAGRILRLKPLDLEAIRFALTPTTGFFK